MDVSETSDSLVAAIKAATDGLSSTRELLKRILDHVLAERIRYTPWNFALVLEASPYALVPPGCDLIDRPSWTRPFVESP